VTESECEEFPLLADARHCLLFLWANYAAEDDANMTGDARRLAAATRAVFAEIARIHEGRQ
jgi:hypothetical protein